MTKNVFNVSQGVSASHRQSLQIPGFAHVRRLSHCPAPLCHSSHDCTFSDISARSSLTSVDELDQSSTRYDADSSVHPVAAYRNRVSGKEVL